MIIMHASIHGLNPHHENIQDETAPGAFVKVLKFLMAHFAELEKSSMLELAEECIKAAEDSLQEMISPEELNKFLDKKEGEDLPLMMIHLQNVKPGLIFYMMDTKKPEVFLMENIITGNDFIEKGINFIVENCVKDELKPDITVVNEAINRINEIMESAMKPAHPAELAESKDKPVDEQSENPEQQSDDKPF